MSDSAPHLWVVGSSRAERRAAAVLGEADVVVDCHRRLRGAYSGITELLAWLVPQVQARDPRLVQRHDTELLSIAPALKTVIQPSHETLTSLAVPKERTRFYAAERTRRLAHGAVEFLNAEVRATGRALTLAFDTAHEADPTTQEFLAILLRRADRSHLRLVVGSSAAELHSELRMALESYARRVEAAPLADRPAPPDDADFLDRADLLEAAIAYLASDGTSDDPWLRAAYDRLDPSTRARLHDERAEELERSDDESLRLGAIPYHREHGSNPSGTGARALLHAINYFLDMGFYPALHDVGMRARAVVDPVADPLAYFIASTKVTTALLRQGRPDEAERIYFELRNRYLYPYVHLAANYAVGMLYARHSDPAKRDYELAKVHLNTSVALADQAEEDRPFKRAFQRNGLALVEMRLGNLERALELVQWGLDHLTEQLGEDEHMLHRSVLLHNRAQLRVGLGRLREALADLDTIIRVDPNYPEYRFDRAGVHRMLGDFEAALADYDTAIAISPPFPEVHYNRGDLLAEMGRVTEAIEEFGYVLELEPDYVDARINRATLRYEQGDLDAAAEDVETGLRFHPTNPHLLTTLGLVQMERGDAAAAEASFTAALAADPRMRGALSNRAVLAFEAGRPEQALADLSAAIEAHGKDAQLFYNRGFVYQQIGDHDAAVADFTSALELPGVDAAELLRKRAECHAAAGRTELAAADLRACLDLGEAGQNAEIEALLDQLTAA